MSENAKETRSTKRPSPSKKFSKVWLLQILGLLSKKFNYETMEFKDSSLLSFVFYFTVLSKPLFALKPLVSCFFPQTDRVQLLIGSIYNYLPTEPRLLMAIATVIAGFWTLGFHVVFNWLNAKKSYRLFKFWMKLTHELPVKSDEDYRVAGLSQEENKKFWAKERSFNRIWYRGMNFYIALTSFTYSSQLFFVTFDGVDIYSTTYILIQAIHVIHTSHALFASLHCFYSLNLLYVTCMRFFSKRFDYIGRQVQSLSTSEMSERINNRELTRLVIEYNGVHHDLILINDFWKFYFGFNLLAFFAMGVTTVTTVLLDTDMRLKAAFFLAIAFLYIVILYFPFVMAKSVTKEINKTKRRFENIAFHSSVNRVIRNKIESISNLSDKAGFSCFDWYLLGPFVGLRISMEFATTLLLLLQTSFYYVNS